jgi:hypothetical protein
MRSGGNKLIEHHRAPDMACLQHWWSAIIAEPNHAERDGNQRKQRTFSYYRRG